MSVSQASSSDSEMESDVSDIQMQPRPSSRLMVSRRLSQQRRRAPSTDYSQLSEESTGEGNDEDSEGDDVDVEDTDFPSTCYSRARMAVKRRNRPRIDQLQRKYHPEKMNLLTKKVEQKRNISSLFQPQSPLVSENMKVTNWCYILCVIILSAMEPLIAVIANRVEGIAKMHFISYQNNK